MAELNITITPELEGLRKLTTQITELEAKKFQITDPKELIKITEQANKLQSEFRKLALSLSTSDIQNYFGTLNKKLSDVASQAHISQITVNQAIGAMLRDALPQDLQQYIRQIKEDIKEQAEEARQAMKAFNGDETSKELQELEDRYASLKDAVTRYANVVEGMDSNKKADEILRETNERVQSNDTSKNTSKERVTQANKNVESAFDRGYQSVVEAMKEGEKETDKWLTELQKLTEEAKQKALEATRAYESLKRALPKDADTKQLRELKAKMEEATSESTNMTDMLNGAQSAVRNLGSDTKGITLFGKKLLVSTKQVTAMRTAMSYLPAPIQQASGGFLQLAKSAGVFLASPIGLTILAITGAVKAMNYAFTTTASGIDDLTEKAEKTAKIKGIFAGIADEVGARIGHIGDTLINIFSGDFKKAWEDSVKFAEESAERQANAIAKEQEAALLEVKLNHDRLEASKEAVELDAKASEARAKMYESTDQHVRLEAIGEARDAINKKYETEIELAKQALKIQELHVEASRSDEEEIAKAVELENNLKRLEQQRHQEQMMFIRQETAARKAIKQEDINERYKELEIQNKEDKDFNQFDDNTHRKNVKDIDLDREAQLTALHKKLEQDLLNVDENNTEKRQQLQEQFERETLHVQQMADKKKQKENRDFWERIHKETRDNMLSIAKEQVELSDNMNEAIVRQIKERYSIQAEETNKAIILIELEKQEQLNAINDQIKAWKRAGEYTKENQQYAEQKISQIESDTDKQKADKLLEIQNELADKNDELTKQRYDKQQDTLGKSLILINVEKEAQLRALEEERKQWLETYGQMDEATKQLFDERQKLIGKNAELEASQLLSEKYQTTEDKFSKARQRYDTDRETLVQNGYVDEALMLNQTSQDEYENLGAEYLDRNKELFAEWLEGVAEMSTEELNTEAEQLKKELNQLLVMGTASNAQILSIYGKLNKVKSATTSSEKKFAKQAKNISKVYSAAGDALSTLAEETDEDTQQIAEAMQTIVGDGVDMIQNISTLATSTTEATKGVAEGASEAIKGVERASVILAIIGAALAIIQKISKLIKTSDTKYEEANEKQQEMNELTSSVNRYTAAVLEAEHAEKNWFSSTGVNSVAQSWETAQQALKSYTDKANEMQVTYQNKKGGSVLGAILNPLGQFNGGYSNIKGVVDLAHYEGSLTKATDNLRIETRKAKKGFVGIGSKDQKTANLKDWVKEKYGEDLFDKDGMINATLAKEVIDTYGNKLQGETQATLEELIEMKEQYDEAMQQIADFTADMYSPVVDNMVDALLNWLDTGENVMDSFREYASDTFRTIAQDMIKQMVQDQVFGSYEEDMKNLYQSYAKGDLGTIGSEQALKELAKKSALLSSDVMNNFDQQAEGLKAFTQAISDTYKSINIDISGIEEQEATYGGYETMSEQTGTELSGRFSAMYIVQSDLLNETKANNKLLISNIMSVSNLAEKANAIMSSSLQQLQAINSNTQLIQKLTKNVDDRMELWHNHILNL